jgi:acetaldehyde dehydrogenase/alcohol dehydrogenase
MTTVQEKPQAQAVEAQLDANVVALAGLDALIARVKQAQKVYATYSQAQVDAIFKKAAAAANRARIELAKQAVAETRMGIVEDKVIKNHFASEIIYNQYRDTKTCGLLEEDLEFGIRKIAEPIGVIAGVVPTTNPTSTAIFKALLALKTRNGIIFSPHPRAKGCTVEAARIVLEAAVKAGAPADIIGWVEEPTVPISQALMQHPDIALVLATGGPGMVKAAYSSGKPALGVGAGNTPVLIDDSADIKMAVNSIVMSKTFDNGVICASEQSLVVLDSIYDQVVRELDARGCKLVHGQDREKLVNTVFPEGHLSPKVVGQSALQIAELAGIHASADCRILMATAEEVGPQEPMSMEKLSPVLAIYRVHSFEQGLETAEKLVAFGGSGHTSVLHVHMGQQERIDAFQKRMKTGRTLINMPASHGAIGDIYNFRLTPSLTLGCGSWGGNSASENIGVQHLLNVKTVAERRENMQWFQVPPRIYFKHGALKYGLSELKGRKRAFIVTDRPLFDLGYCAQVTDILDTIGISYSISCDIEPDPTLSSVERILKQLRSFEPDVIIALGGGSPMDAAKVLWLMYEQPDIAFEDVAMRFMDIRKRIAKVPELGEKAAFVAIPTTSGTGSEVTPFSVITDDREGVKYPLADYALTPTMALIDPSLVQSLPPRLAAVSGIDALTHALEAYVSVLATPFTNGLALEAIQLIFDHLDPSVNAPKENSEAREQMHYAATIAGMAFANAFLGVCHSMAHKLGSTFHIPHGTANALLISQVIRYNASDNPEKLTAFPQYRYPCAKTRYARIADMLGLGGNSADEKVDRLINAVEDLKARVGMPKSIQACGVDEARFFLELDRLAEQAFDDQCTGGNPRYPLMQELKTMLTKAYYGDTNA